MAAGFSLKKNNFNKFKKYLSNYKISNNQDKKVNIFQKFLHQQLI